MTRAEMLARQIVSAAELANTDNLAVVIVVADRDNDGEVFIVDKPRGIAARLLPAVAGAVARGPQGTYSPDVPS